jgi:hypothetical protein
VNCPPVARRLPARCKFIVCLFCSCELMRRSFEVSKFCCRGFVGPSALGYRTVRVWVGPSAQRPRTVRAARVALGQSACRVQTIRVSGCAANGPVAFNGASARGPRTVRPVLADYPPLPRGPSARAFAEQLSPLLLQSCFRFGIVWSLFLGLVGPL